MQVLEVLNKISKILNKICEWFCILAFTVMTIAFGGQVFSRYILGRGLVWTEELTRYTNIAMVMVGAAILAGRGAHINIGTLEDALPPKYRKWLIVLQQTLMGIFFGAAIFIGFTMIRIAGTQISTNMRMPMRYVFTIFPIAYSILLFQLVVFTLNKIFKEGDVK